MTYPLCRHMTTHVHEAGDTLLNTWIVARNVEKLAAGDLGNFFETTMFYPHRRTLAYSELLLTQSVIAIPVYVLSANPLLTYNVLFLLAFATSGLGMYFLAAHLTRHRPAAVVAGLIYAFSPFMFGQLTHLQSLTAGGIPLALLFLHRFLEHLRIRDVLLFTLFYILQVLACGYYAVFLSLFAGLFVAYYAIARRLVSRPRFWLCMALSGAIALLAIAPLFYPYIALRRETGFVRSIDVWATTRDLFKTAPFNRLYGKLTQDRWVNEALVFPGFVALVLAVFGFAGVFRRSEGKRQREVRCVYAAVALLAFSFTFGPHGPYPLLHRYVPGFNGLRVPSRFQVFVMLGIAVLAAFAVRLLARSARRYVRWLGVAVVPALVVVESASFPIPVQEVPRREEIPEVYTWLAEQHDIDAIIEYPLHQWSEYLRLYCSIYHKKHSVNGWSGYLSKTYDTFREREPQFPSTWSLTTLEEMGVDTLIVHRWRYTNDQWREIEASLDEWGERVVHRGTFGDAHVYRLANALPAVHSTTRSGDAAPQHRR